MIKHSIHIIEGATVLGNELVTKFNEGQLPPPKEGGL